MWPPPHIYLPNTIQMNLNGQNSCAHTKTLVAGGKKGVEKIVFAFPVFPTNIIEFRIEIGQPQMTKKKKKSLEC